MNRFVISGMLAAGIAISAYAAVPKPPHADFTQLVSDIGIDASQQQQVAAILQSAQQQRQALLEQSRKQRDEQLDNLDASTLEQLVPMLTAKQLAKVAQVQAEARRLPPGPPPARDDAAPKPPCPNSAEADGNNSAAH